MSPQIRVHSENENSYPLILNFRGFHLTSDHMYHLFMGFESCYDLFILHIAQLF